MNGFFENLVVAGIPLLLVVLGLVEWSKLLGLTGKVLRVVSMAIGLTLGIGYQLSLAAPITFADWFEVSVFGLALGLTASGVYDAFNKK
jgi:hypothetical protein